MTGQGGGPQEAVTVGLAGVADGQCGVGGGEGERGLIVEVGGGELGQLGPQKLGASLRQVARKLRPHELAGAVRCACGYGVGDRLVLIEQGGVEIACPQVQSTDASGVAVTQLGAERFAHERVQAIGVVLACDQGEAGAEQIVEDVHRAGAVQQGVAEGAGELGADRGEGQEFALVGVELVEELLAQISGHHGTVSPEIGQGRLRIGLLGGRQGRQAECGRPTLGALQQGLALGRCAGNAGEIQQVGSLGFAHRQVVGAELEQGAVCPQTGQGQGQRPAGGEHELGTFGEMLGHLGEDVQGGLVGEQVEVVEYQ